MTYIYVDRRQRVKAGGTYINQCAVTVPRYNTIDFIIQFCAARELNKIGNVSTYKRNMDACSRNHCDRVMSVFPYSCFRYTACKSHFSAPYCIVVCGLSGYTIFFPALGLSRKWHDLRKEKMLLDTKCLF